MAGILRIVVFFAECVVGCMGIVALLLAKPTRAMDFEVWTVSGEPAIIGSGPIVPGDADRLKSVLEQSARHSAGYFALALNSPGGSVEAAFAVSSVITKHKINTYVPPNFECVSACAAIEFIAGAEHVIVPGGLLGFHGCYDSGTKKLVGLCNENIAQHALEHGTAYGSVMAFVERTPYDKIIWFSADQADCYAISRYTISPTPNNYEQCIFDAIRKFAK